MRDSDSDQRFSLSEVLEYYDFFGNLLIEGSALGHGAESMIIAAELVFRQERRRLNKFEP